MMDTKSSLFGWLKEGSRGLKILVGLICTLCLALFLHFRQVRLEILEVGQMAQRYVIAQVDFEFPDYEMTVILRQQAIQDIGKIYAIDEKMIKEIRLSLEQKLIRSKEWRSIAPSSTFEEMYKAADELETLLFQMRFTDPRTLQIVRELMLNQENYFEYIPDQEKETVPSDFWPYIENRLEMEAAFPKEAVDYVTLPFTTADLKLIEDEPLEHNLRAQVSRNIPEKFSKVYAGSRILSPGEEITARHIVMMQAMKQAIADGRRLFEPLPILASFLLSLILVMISTLYFSIIQPNFIRSLRQISLFVSIVILTLIFAKLTEYVLIHSSSSIIGAVRYPVVAPFAALLVSILLSPRTALFAATFLSIILSVSLAIDHSRFLILNLVTSIVVVITSKGIRKRKEVFSVCAKTWLSSIPVLYSFLLSEDLWISNSFCIDVISSALFLIATAILVAGLLPILESIFGVLTDMTLMEFMDPENELLRKFALEVPGTYQHSLVLGHLAETCASAIGANGLFCRAATLYHDIGKMNNPQLYTENQQGSVNLHQLLTPYESAQVIISHVTDGVNIAKRYGLPQPFIDIIQEHHGTTLVYYFYRKQLDLKGGRKEEVKESDFRYPGPRPRTKESAIIMICDSIEATSRSLDETGEVALREMVERVVSQKADDGQFTECQLTFEELSQVKRVLVKTLLLTHHVRIKYPKREEPKEPPSCC